MQNAFKDKINQSMRKQIIKVLQRKPEPKQKQDNSFHNRSRGEVLLSNKLQDQKALQIGYQTNDQLGIDFFNRSKEGFNKEPKDLLHKIKAVQRISLTPFQESKLQESVTLVKDVHTQRLALEEKLKEEKLKEEKQKKQRKEVKGENPESFRLMFQRTKEEKQKLEMHLKVQEVETQLLRKQLGVYLKQIDILKEKNVQLQEENVRLRSQIQHNKSKVKQLREQHRESEDYSLSKLIELQEYIENLKCQNEELLRQRENPEKLKQMQNQTKQRDGEYKYLTSYAQPKRNNKIELFSATLKVVVSPSQLNGKSLIEQKSKDLQLNLLDAEKRYTISINNIRKQHQEQIASLKQTFYKNLNFYREMVKNCGPISGKNGIKDEQTLQQNKSTEDICCYESIPEQQQKKDQQDDE